MVAVGVGVHFVASAAARAELVVLSNRTTQAMTVTAMATDEPAREVVLGVGDSRPIFYDGQLRIRYMQGEQPQEYLVDSYSAYYFGTSPHDGQLELEKIGLAETPSSSSARDWRHSLGGVEAATIPVKILVDDDEPTHRKVWEPRLRKRIDRASQVLEQHCGIRLKVVSVDTWDSDDNERDFFRSLGELEREVVPKPARLAIGFSSQYRIARGRVHLGGTRGPLHSHILLREYARQVRESERLELLVHELGHFLGAAHSPESDSVMRPVLSGGLQRGVDARVRFDPVNTLLIAMTGEEIRRRRVRKLADFTLPTKRRMRQIYSVLGQALPDDPAAGQYVRIVGAAATGPLVADTRKILRQIVRVAELRQKKEEGGEQSAVGSEKKNGSLANDPAIAATLQVAGEQKLEAPNKKPEGDTLTELLVRQAALAARQVRRENAERALLLALGIAMDNTDMLRSLPWTQSLVRHVESKRERKQRLAVLGSPTMRGRGDLTKHFFVSAFAVVVHGSKMARSAGMAKELLDAQHGSGFSFADMAANRAGILFAHAVLSKRLSLDEVANGFTVEGFLPSIDGLEEGLTASELRRLFGGLGDPRFDAELGRIERRVMALPVYRRPTWKPTNPR